MVKKNFLKFFLYIFFGARAHVRAWIGLKHLYGQKNFFDLFGKKYFIRARTRARAHARTRVPRAHAHAHAHARTRKKVCRKLDLSSFISYWTRILGIFFNFELWTLNFSTHRQTGIFFHRQDTPLLLRAGLRGPALKI